MAVTKTIIIPWDFEYPLHFPCDKQKSMTYLFNYNIDKSFPEVQSSAQVITDRDILIYHAIFFN